MDGVYGALGFEAADDQVFKQLVLARIIEPASKLDGVISVGAIRLN
ncbi:MAG: hypothetical protein HPY50_12770 [Firmicutes bacterium]|nr:hypothetical protein [Bacillota bacterium]